MKLLDNMTVRVSWSLVLAVFSALILALGGLGLYAARHSENALKSLNEVNVDQQSTLNRANTGMLIAQVNMRNLQARLLVSTAPEEVAAVRSEAEALSAPLADVEGLFQKFLDLPRQDHQQDLFAELSDGFTALMEQGLWPQQRALAEGNADRFQALSAEVATLGERYFADTEAFSHGAAQSSATLYGDYLELAGMLQWLIIAALAAAAATVVVVLWGVTANVIRPLGRLVGYFERMQQGNMAQRIPTLGNNEIGRLYASLAAMQQGLAETVTTVRDSSESIYQGTQSIAHGNNDLSARTEQQAASLQESAASMEEFASTVSQNADNASQASRLAGEATRTAQQGGEVVDEVTATMHEISQGSRRVAEIIGTIDSIAFQTNILALNASVEAARAGEHGRGFAVVAQEVRSLASRSGDAAGEIRGLIETSVTQVEAGTERANRAGQTMAEVVASVQRVSDIMDEIAAASAEQNEGIGQVNDAIAQLDQVTQQNAGLVQQAASAANQLEAEASRLRAAVNHFQLGERTTDPDADRSGSDDLARWMPALMPQRPSLTDASDDKSRGTNDSWESF